MSNIQKAFKTKSKLRGMADGGLARREVNPDVLGTGGAARAGHQIRAHNRNTAAEIDALFAPAASPAPQPASPAKKPKEKSALRSFFGLADGGQVQVFKNTVGGVPTYTDAKAATAGAKPYTPGQGGGTFSVISTPTRTPSPSPVPTQPAPQTGGAPSPSPVPTQPAPQTGAPSPSPAPAQPAPQTGAPADDVDRIMNSRDMSTFTPREVGAFNSMGQAAAANAAQMRDIGVQAGEAAAAAARPASPLQFNSFDAPSFELESDGELEFADGGKVKGKGGPTDDKVGPVMLSDGEYVLPADTVAAIGKENLDALRDATHTFVDPKKSKNGLRGMANGTPSGPLYADPEGVASRRLLNMGLDQLPQPAAGSSGGGGRGIVPHQPTATGSPGGGGRGLVPYQPPTGPSTAMVRPAPQKIHIANPAGGPPGGGGIPPGGGGNLLRLLGRVGLVGNALAALPAVNASVGEWARGIPGVLRGESAPQPNTKVRFLDEDGQPVSAPTAPSPQGPTPVEDVLGSSAMANASDLSSGGGIDGRYSGAMENYSGLPNSDPRINGSTSALYNARGDDDVVGSFQGKPMTKREADARAAGLQTASFMPPEREPSQADQMRSLLREFGVGDGGGGGGPMPASRAREINARYDQLAKQLSGMYGREGQGNLARRLLELENSRSSALGADQSNRSALRGQDMQAAASAANNRTAAMQAIAGMMERQQKAAADAQAAGLKAAQDAAAAERSASETGVKDLDSYIETAFPDDPQEADRFRTFVQSAGPELVGELTTQYGGDRRRAFEDMRQRMLIQDRGGGGNILTGQRSSGYDPVASVNLDPGLADILNAQWNGGMGLWDSAIAALKEFSPFDNALVTHDSGQVRPASKLRGGDMRSTKVIEDMIADRPRREALRRAATDN